MTFDTQQRVRRKLIGLIFLCLSVRVVMPFGYMPAPIDEGGPFVLCPGTASGASLILAAQALASGNHAAHADEHEHAADDGSHFWEFCQFGAVFGTAVTASEVAFIFPEPAHSPPAASPQLPARSTAARSFNARAPPRLMSRSV